MGRLAIRKVRYVGDSYHFESPYLNDGIVIIEGENGNGKTTFMNLIYFGLGGIVKEFKSDSKSDWKHTQIVNDTNNYVELEIEINKEKFILTRYFNANIIFIRDESDEISDSVIYRQDTTSDLVFSDWILEKLGIEVFDIIQGEKSFKIGFNDLMRLIYHDQLTENLDVYKTSDNSNFLTDSLEIRKAIFEILIGRNYNEYYKTLGEYKKSQKEFDTKRTELKTYSDFLFEILGEEIPNLYHLNEDLTKNKHLLKRLEKDRDFARIQKNNPENVYKQIEMNSLKLSTLQIEINLLYQEERELLSTINKYNLLFDNLNDEVEKIEKIRFVHNSLNLFSPDTCPYCLKKTNREPGKCICGSKINEEDYERFFYNDDEYVDILTRKKKSLINLANVVKRKNDSLRIVDVKREKLEGQKNNIKTLINELTKDIKSDYNSAKVREYDKRILEIQNNIADLEQSINLESKRSNIQKRVDNLKKIVNSQKAELDKLDASARIDIQEKIIELSDLYYKYMREVLRDCRSAYIKLDNYIPVINNGEYRESSAAVTIRLMYFFCLLYISLKDNDIKYPKLLLIDTPQKKGIDLDALKNAISRLNDLYFVGVTPKEKTNTEKDESEEEVKCDEEINTDFQIILTTGPSVYPDELEENIAFRMLGKRIEDKLLKKNK